LKVQGLAVAPLLALPALALLLLAAHLLHAGFMVATAVAVLLGALLAVRRPWAARVLQLVLVLAVVEWVLTAARLAQLRAQHDQPYLRLVLILGGVAGFTALAAALLQHRRLRSWCGRPALGPARDLPR
jgi:hypothetical protein